MEIIDTRDLSKRKDELESLKDVLEDADKELSKHLAKKPATDSEEWDEWEEQREELETALEDAAVEFDSAEEQELDELKELESEISDFHHGEAMIAMEDFVEYAEQLAEDTGAIGRHVNWPLNCIDWERAAEELADDYILVSYQGKDYYARS